MRRLRAAAGFATVLVAVSPPPAQGDEAGALGRKVFTEIAQPSCAICHTLQAAGAAGTVGPSLDELKPDRERALQAVRNGVGVMPPYRDTLSPKEIEAVAAYVARTAGRPQ